MPQRVWQKLLDINHMDYESTPTPNFLLARAIGVPMFSSSLIVLLLAVAALT